jgi:hypothetical protein
MAKWFNFFLRRESRAVFQAGTLKLCGPGETDILNRAKSSNIIGQSYTVLSFTQY